MYFIPLDSLHQDESNGSKIVSLGSILTELRYNKVLSIILVKIILILAGIMRDIYLRNFYIVTSLYSHQKWTVPNV